MTIISSVLTTLSTALYLISNSLNGGNYIPKNIFEINNVKYPVCVVGAGISGMNVATLLQDKGYQVYVFEKKATVGGKIITYREGDEIQVEMAPLLFTRSNERIINKMNEHGLTMVPYNESDVGLFDATSGALYPRPSLTSEQMGQLSQAIRHYTFHYSKYRNDLEPGYLNASPEIFVPISEWLDSRNLTALKPIFTLVVTTEGYGHLNDLPALYALKFISPDILAGVGSFAGSFLVVKEGLDVLANRMAAPLTIFLNTEMTRISREGPNPTVVFGDESTGGYNTQKCKAVILAFPPLLQNLEKIVVDLNEDEKNVLANVKIHRYTSAAHQISNPSLVQSLHYDPNLKEDGEVAALIRQSSKKRDNIFSSYSWIRGDFTSAPTVMDLLKIENKLDLFLRKFDLNAKTFYRTAFEYFPHVGTSALRNGFYRKLNSIQGLGGLFYATTLLTFETMDSALYMTEVFVDKYF